MTTSTTSRMTLRTVALGYLFALVAVPIGVILWRTFSPGLRVFIDSVSTPAAQSALNLSLLIVAIVVPLNAAAVSVALLAIAFLTLLLLRVLSSRSQRREERDV